MGGSGRAQFQVLREYVLLLQEGRNATKRQSREHLNFPLTAKLDIAYVILKLVVCILLRVLGQVQGFRLTQHWFEYFIQ
jgi:hypothetical protein